MDLVKYWLIMISVLFCHLGIVKVCSLIQVQNYK